MIFVDVNHLKPGMICAKDLNIPTSVVPLLLANYPITSENIMRLKAMNLPGVYVKTSIELNLGSTDFIDPSVKQAITSNIKDVFCEFTGKSSISNHLVKKMEQAASDLVDFILQKESYILNVLEIKSFDDYTYSHSINVASLSTLIGLGLGYSSVSLKELALAGLLHDIGKLEIPLSIINKPAPLNSFEFDIIKNHPDLGLKKLKNSMRISHTVLSGVCTHHERFDGTGYPNGITGANIPLCGRIIAVADVFDALTTCRIYRPPMSVKDTLDYMLSLSGTHFDPYLIDTFFKIVCVYPVGTTVRLSDSSTAVVLENVSGHMLDPIITILDSHTFSLGDTIDLSKYDNLFIVNTLDPNSPIPDEVFEYDNN